MKCFYGSARGGGQGERERQHWEADDRAPCAARCTASLQQPAACKHGPVHCSPRPPAGAPTRIQDVLGRVVILKQRVQVAQVVTLENLQAWYSEGGRM